ncbi:MAG: hypothetical protein G01um101429_897 [Parcubacteria group bacterium Gr01-1014_29]|nr:MAG: hypothetical protein G01um101429_897 [Parcubacteria group bacterium Gr01-1014_29]
MENSEKQPNTKGSKARSRLYPRYDLEEAIKFIQLVSRLGRKNVSEKSVADEDDKKLTNSGFLGRMSSAKQFALISRVDGKLSLTQLGNEIMFPLDDTTKARAIKKAFAMPTLYKELVDAFSGNKIPEYSSLGNRLINDYRIEACAKDVASKNFIKSAEYAGVMQNGILVIENDLIGQSYTGQESGNAESVSFPQASALTNTKQVNSYHDSGDGWMLTVKSTRPLTSEIKKKLVDIAEFLEHGSAQGN